MNLKIEKFQSTPEGIYVGDQSFNLLDFSNWELQGMAQGLGTYFYDAETCMTLKGRVYGDINDTESDSILRIGIPLQKSFQKVDV